MKIKLTLLFLILFSYQVSAEQETLLYLYGPTLNIQQKKAFDRMTSHANNEEFEAASSLSEALLETHQSDQEQNRKVYGQLMINHGIIRSAALDYEQGLITIEKGLEHLEHHRNPFSPLLYKGIMAKAITEFSLNLSEKAQV